MLIPGKDGAMNPKRRFTVEVKRQVVERLLSGTVSAAYSAIAEGMAKNFEKHKSGE